MCRKAEATDVTLNDVPHLIPRKPQLLLVVPMPQLLLIMMTVVCLAAVGAGHDMVASITSLGLTLKHFLSNASNDLSYNANS